METGRILYPDDFDDTIYLMDWGWKLEQLTRSSHGQGFDFEATGHVVAIVKIKPKEQKNFLPKD